MTFSIEKAIREGIQRTFARNGLLLVGVVIFISVVDVAGGVAIDMIFTRGSWAITAESFTSSGFSVTTYSLSGFGEQTEGQGLTDDLIGFGFLSASAASVYSIVTTVMWAAFWIIGTRIFASDHTDTIPREFIRHNIGFATLNVVVGRVVVSWLVVIGFLLLIVPGVILSIAMLFVAHAIAIRDEHFVNAMRHSWRLMKPHIIPVLIVGIALAILLVLVPVWLIPAALFGWLFATLPLWLAGLLAVLLDAVLTVLGIAVVARAYAQLNPSFIRKHWDLSVSPSPADG